MKDCHVHSVLSYDGKSKIHDYIASAHLYGVDEITFTEHLDLLNDLSFNIDLDNYLSQYISICKNSLVQINFGLEVGLRPEYVSLIQSEISKYCFDFIIGSTHTIGDLIISDENLVNEDIDTLYLRYLKETLLNVKLYDNYDVYGHLDYIIRYKAFDNMKPIYATYQDLIDEILISLIKKDKGLEVNSSAYRFGCNSPHPSLEILERYKSYGGKIITIGSDAHKTKELAKDFDSTIEVIEKCGFDEICVFHQRQPNFIKIKKLKL